MTSNITGNYVTLNATVITPSPSSAYLQQAVWVSYGDTQLTPDPVTGFATGKATSATSIPITGKTLDAVSAYFNNVDTNINPETTILETAVPIASPAQLVCGTASPDSDFYATSPGTCSFSISYKASSTATLEVIDVTGLAFNSQVPVLTTLNSAPALQGKVVVSKVADKFVFTSANSGTGVTLSYLSPVAVPSGTDISSTLLKGSSTAATSLTQGANNVATQTQAVQVLADYLKLYPKFSVYVQKGFLNETNFATLVSSYKTLGKKVIGQPLPVSCCFFADLQDTDDYTTILFPYSSFENFSWGVYGSNATGAQTCPSSALIAKTCSLSVTLNGFVPAFNGFEVIGYIEYPEVDPSIVVPLQNMNASAIATAASAGYPSNRILSGGKTITGKQLGTRYGEAYTLQTVSVGLNKLLYDSNNAGANNFAVIVPWGQAGIDKIVNTLNRSILPQLKTQLAIADFKVKATPYAVWAKQNPELDFQKIYTGITLVAQGAGVFDGLVINALFAETFSDFSILSA